MLDRGLEKAGFGGGAGLVVWVYSVWLEIPVSVSSRGIWGTWARIYLVASTEEIAATEVVQHLQAGLQESWQAIGAEGHGIVGVRDLEWSTLATVRGLVEPNRGVVRSQSVLGRRGMHALLEEWEHVVPAEVVISHLLCPEVVASARATLVNHLVARRRAAEGFALGIVDDCAIELLCSLR